MGTDAPEWINTEFLEKILKKSEKDETIKVKDFQVKPASKANEHLASVMYRVIVIYSGKLGNSSEISLIIKSKPFLEGFKKDLFGNDDIIFEVETKMYLDTLPEMQKLINVSEDKSVLAPKMLYSESEPSPILVFEDISTKGFAVCDELQLNHTQKKQVISRLAQFHAASMVMHNKNQGIKDFNQSLFHLHDNDNGLNFMKLNMQSFIDEIKTWTGYEIYVEKFENILKNFDDLSKKHAEPNKIGEGYNVLNHGDFHIKNLMFKNKDNPTLSELILIDFQMVFYASPAYDFYYCIYFMGHLDDREDIINDLKTHYYESFSNNLKNMDYKMSIPSFKDFQDELTKHGLIEVLFTIGLAPFIFLDVKELDLEEIFTSSNTENNVRNNIFSKPKAVKFFKDKLPKFLNEGFLD